MKLPFWGTVLTILGVAILCVLGNWQLQRLQWKTDILDTIEVEYAIDASGVPLPSALFSTEIDFKRGYIIGTYAHEKEILLQARMYEGEVGYHLLTPMRISGEAEVFVLVNRGWVPLDWSGLGDVDARRPAGDIKITGMLRPVPRVSTFVPDNDPKKSMWFRIDLEQIAREKGNAPLAMNMFYVEEEVVQDARYPIASAMRISPKNNHAQYAFFWFAMAVAMVVIYTLRFVVPQMKSKT